VALEDLIGYLDLAEVELMLLASDPLRLYTGTGAKAKQKAINFQDPAATEQLPPPPPTKESGHSSLF